MVDLENSVRGGGMVVFFSQPATYFAEGRTNLPPEAIGPSGSNCFSRGVRTSVSKKTYSHL